MAKRALISVSDKTGVVELSKTLVKFGYEIVSTGGTASLLKDRGVETTDVSSVTGFQELISGKVKTLHPAIFAGILADAQDGSEIEELAKLSIKLFDVVVVNLYPFERAALDGEELEDLIKNIDIGGVSLLRAAAKNYKSVAALSCPSQYELFLSNLAENSGKTDIVLRKELSLAAFERVSAYDVLITNELSKRFELESGCFSLFLNKEKELRYGENPHQKAFIAGLPNSVDYEVLNGKELSYNNILDLSSAVGIVSEFYDVNAVAVVKHTVPCGVALGKSIEDAYMKAFDCDPVSAFGGIIAFSKRVTKEVAEHASSVFLEVVAAPEFDDDALDLLRSKKNLRIIKINTPLSAFRSILKQEVKLTPFGALVQEFDNKELQKDSFKVVSKSKPNSEMVEDMVFAWKVAKYVKSNAIVIAKDLKTLAVSGGQTSRVDAVEMALNKSCEPTKDAVMASDGFFPAVDNINAAAQGRIAAIIQPGGSIKDNDVINACDKFNIAMITTGIRHFKH